MIHIMQRIVDYAGSRGSIQTLTRRLEGESFHHRADHRLETLIIII